MKLFLDTANLTSIERSLKTGLINGVTTNPTHLSKEGDILPLLDKICTMVHPYDVSIEVTEKEPEEIYKQAKKIAALAPNVVVKVPCTMANTPVIKKLVDEGVAINITLIFTLAQGLAMAKLGVKYISPFMGRLDAIDGDGVALVQDLKTMLDTYQFDTKLLAASLRHKNHLNEAILAGADIATLPVNLFESLLEHPLTTKGIKQFDDDWQKLGIKKFP